MKKKLIGLTVVLVLFVMSIPAFAALEVIGTVTYDDGSGEQEYNLIWERYEDISNKSVVWLDYTNNAASWIFQQGWAATLETHLAYNIDSAYTVTWDDANWRLPVTDDGTDGGGDGSLVNGCDGTTNGGYNITTSEIGHLYYTELGNLGCKDTSCDPSTGCQNGSGLLNTFPFQNLIAMQYWSGTEYAPGPSFAWNFIFGPTGAYDGRQYYLSKTQSRYGLAIRIGQVTTSQTSLSTVTTQAVDGISVTTATGNGNITDLGVPEPTQHGVCWSTSTNPTVDDVNDFKTTDGAASATGAFTSSMTGLTHNTLYYVRAYATNTVGTSYGNEVIFTTEEASPEEPIPTLNEWGMIITSCLLALAAFTVLRRREEM